MDRIKQHVGDIVSSQLAVGRLLHRLHERGETKRDGHRRKQRTSTKTQEKRKAMEGKSENNKELLGFVGERKKTRVNNEVSIMRCPTTWLGPPTRWGGPLVGNVDSSAGTGIELLKYPPVQATYLKPFGFQEPPGPGIFGKKKTPDSKERTTGSGSLQNLQGTSGCHEGPETTRRVYAGI